MDGLSDPVACFVCSGTRWVCETHPDRPWSGKYACGCGGAGMPCSNCRSVPPNLPEGFKAETQR